MVQPTNRVIAKTLARVLRDFTKMIDVSDIEAAVLLSTITAKIVKDNRELEDAVVKVLRETKDDIAAEAAGLASSTVNSPVAAPWNEDAGSGQLYPDAADYDPAWPQFEKPTGRDF